MADFKDPSPTSTLETRSLSNSPPAGNGHGAAAAPTDDTRSSLADSDEAVLARLGYKQEFVREFTNLSVSPFAPVPVRQAAPSLFFPVFFFISRLRLFELICGHTMCYRLSRSRSRSWGAFPIRAEGPRRGILGPRSANQAEGSADARGRVYSVASSVVSTFSTPFLLGSFQYEALLRPAELID